MKRETSDIKSAQHPLLGGERKGWVILGDALEEVKKLSSDSIDCVITSPPYYQLRDYGFKAQWGLEKTYQEYLDKMIVLMAELKRVLKPTGTMWINLGDTYGGSNCGTTYDTNCVGKNGIKTNTDKWPRKGHSRFELSKCLMLIPHRFAIRCVDELGLILRNDVIWAKRNGMPESVTDRFSKKHEFIFFFVKQQKYFFDLDGVRKPLAYSSILRLQQNIDDQIGSDRVPGKSNGNMKAVGKLRNKAKENYGKGTGNYSAGYRSEYHYLGSNPGDVSDFWDIPTKPCSEKHYATFNSALIDKPIIAGCPEFVCIKCGKPREKIFTKSKWEKFQSERNKILDVPGSVTYRGGTRNEGLNGLKREPSKFLKYKHCNCNAGFEGGVILDPFCGIGTTLLRGLQLNRQVIGIDGKKEYCDIAEKRINEITSQMKLAI